MRFSATLCVSVLVLTAVLARPSTAAAEGAVAVGSSGNIAADGVAVGISLDQSTPAEAAAEALKNCNSYRAAHNMAASCVIVGSFKRECISTAYDLKAGTPGFGWAIGPDKAKANERALAACQATAGEDRRAFCQLLTSKCDARD